MAEAAESDHSGSSDGEELFYGPMAGESLREKRARLERLLGPSVQWSRDKRLSGPKKRRNLQMARATVRGGVDRVKNVNGKEGRYLGRKGYGWIDLSE